MQVMEALSATSNSPVACNASLMNPTIACAPECATLLGTIRDDYGCCINMQYPNMPGWLIQIQEDKFKSTMGLVNYELWSCYYSCSTESDATVLLNNVCCTHRHRHRKDFLIGGAQFLIKLICSTGHIEWAWHRLKTLGGGGAH